LLRESTISADSGVHAGHGATATLRDVKVLAVSNGVAAHDGGQLRLSNVLVTTSRSFSTGFSVADGSEGTVPSTVNLGPGNGTRIRASPLRGTSTCAATRT
jgi:hypothetical protein